MQYHHNKKPLLPLICAIANIIVVAHFAHNKDLLIMCKALFTNMYNMHILIPGWADLLTCFEQNKAAI
jgi:hypothetical protein